MIALAPDLANVIVPGTLVVADAQVLAHDPRLDAPLKSAEQRLRGDQAALDPTIAAVRAMYRRVGIDPTKTRPSSEALLRRVRKGDALPRINSLVDICNWCSAELQLPYGLYDLDDIVEPITLRLGRAGEEYAGIRKDVVHVTARPTLVDAHGPFGNPTSDSARTMVTTETKRVLIVIYAPRELAKGMMAAALDLTSSRVRQFAGGQEVVRRVDGDPVPPPDRGL